jgi:hypothetical protein
MRLAASLAERLDFAARPRSYHAASGPFGRLTLVDGEYPVLSVAPVIEDVIIGVLPIVEGEEALLDVGHAAYTGEMGRGTEHPRGILVFLQPKIYRVLDAETGESGVLHEPFVVFVEARPPTRRPSTGPRAMQSPSGH